MSAAEEAFLAAWESGPAPVHYPVREYRFHPERQWRFDFAWPEIRLAVEIQGSGTGGARGGHQTIAGMRNDSEKNNEAIRLGWRVLTFPAADKRYAARWVETTWEIMCTTPSNRPMYGWQE